MKQYRDTSQVVDTKRVGGRPRKMKYDQRRNHHKVSFNDEDEAIVQMNAERYGCKDDKYLHDIALTGEVYAHLTDEGTEQLRDVCGLANNTNQIAHSANAAGFTQVKEKAEKVLEMLHELILRILRGGELTDAVSNDEV